MKDAEEIVIPFQKSRKEYLAKTSGAPNLPLSVIEKELLEVEALMQNVESYLLRDDISGESKRLDMATILTLNRVEIALTFMRTMHKMQTNLKAELKEAIDAVRTSNDEKLKGLSEKLGQNPPLSKEEREAAVLFKQAYAQAVEDAKKQQKQESSNGGGPYV